MKLPHLIAGQLPEFVASDYPAFIEFLQAYYTWYEEQYSRGKLSTLLDVDQTVDDFLQHFRQQLDVYGVLSAVDNRVFLRNIKQLYASKGSEASFKFLFKALFGKESTVTYPWDYVFKPSAGVWQQDTSIIVQITKTPSLAAVFALGGNEVIITDALGNDYSVNASDIIQRAGAVDEDIFELFIDRFSYKTPSFVSIRTPDGLIVGDILPTTFSLKIDVPGIGFDVGQVYAISSDNGQGSAIKIKRVDGNGGILSAEFIECGYGYDTNFTVEITPQDAVPYWIDGSVPPPSGSPGAGHAVISFTVGSLCRYPGSYIKSDNLLGDLVYFEDSYYYQAFSYVTTVEATIEQYADILKGSLHPVGTLHFGNYLIQNEFRINPEITSFSLTINDNSKFVSIVSLSDEFDRTIDVSRQLSDNPVVTDLASKTFSKAPFQDSTSVSDNAVKTIGKNIADSILTTDLNTYSLTSSRTLSDSVSLTDLFGRQITSSRDFSDSITVDDVFGKTINKTFADGISITDSTSYTGQLNRTTTDSVGVQDSVDAHK